MPRLAFPAVYICPHVPDAFNITFVVDDIRQHIGQLANEDIKKLIAYAITGGGMIRAVDALKGVSDVSLDRLREMFLTWLDGRNLAEFYNELFVENGYACNEMFVSCKLGDRNVSCCDMFEPAYVMTRGRCLRLISVYQEDPNFHGWLEVSLKLLPSRLVSPDGYQNMMIVHIFSRGAEPFVRYRRYIFHRNTSNSLVLNKRHYKFLDTNGYCNPDRVNRASSTCYYDHWLQRKLLEPYNCTFFYLQRGVENYNVCDPDLVVRKQKLILDTDMGGTKCFPPCERDVRDVEHTYKYKKPIDQEFCDFRIYYTKLESENYVEVPATSPAAFIAELGGQCNLFVGASVICLLQVLLRMPYFLHRVSHRCPSHQ